MLTLFLGGIGAIYAFFGIVTWLNTALAMIGDLSNDPYVSTLRDVSRRNFVLEAAVFCYLFLLWPVHWLVRGVQSLFVT